MKTQQNIDNYREIDQRFTGIERIISGIETTLAVTNEKLAVLLELVREIKDDHRRDIHRIDGEIKDLEKTIIALKEQQITWKGQIGLLSIMGGVMLAALKYIGG